MATIYKRGNSWWLRDGDYRKPLRTRSLRLAKLLLEDYEEEKLRPKKIIRLEAAIARYVEESKPFNKPSHYFDKKRILEKFASSCENVRLLEVDLDPVAKYLNTRHHLSSYRWNTERHILIAFFNWAIRRDFYKAANPVKEMQKKLEPRGKAALALTRSQISKVLLVIKKNADIFDAFRLALNSGLRVQEIENMQFSDLELRNFSMKVQAHSDGWTPKDYEARSVPLNPAAVRIIKKREKLKALSPYLFCNAHGEKHGKDWVTAISRSMRRAGIPHGGWHLTRHTFATRAVENGMDLESLRLIVGHADTKILLKYIHVSPQYKSWVVRKLPNIA